MHIPDGLLANEVCLATGITAASAVGYSLYKVKQQMDENLMLKTGATAGFLFACQMVNFPLAMFSIPVSGHLMGGLLAALLLGPWAGCLAITLVLLVQGLVFADGGLACLGTNVLHMAVIGAWGGYACFTALKRMLGNGRFATAGSTAIAAWSTVMAAALLVCVEMYFSLDAAQFSFTRFVQTMLPFHAAIGVGEALITLAVVKAVSLYSPATEATSKAGLTAPLSRRFAWTTLALAIGVAFLLAPWASVSPDGFEAAVEGEQLADVATGPIFSLLSDYEFAGISAHSESLSVGFAGALGVLAVLALTLMIGRMLPTSTLVK